MISVVVVVLCKDSGDSVGTGGQIIHKLLCIYYAKERGVV